MLCVTLAHYFIVNPAELAEQNTLKTKKTTYVQHNCDLEGEIWLMLVP